MKVSASGHRMLDFDDSYEDNRKMFIDRLVKAGWTRKDASKEYERIQEEDPS
jgi:hypothetical protein